MGEALLCIAHTASMMTMAMGSHCGNSTCVNQMILGGAQSLFETGTLPRLTTFLSSSVSGDSTAVLESATWLLLGAGLAAVLRRMAPREKQ